MEYDCAVIGAGWAGFNAAVAGRQLGLTIALIEQDELGGTCLNRGCIPTKSLIQSAKLFTLFKKADRFGIEVGPPSVAWNRIQERKARLVSQLRQGMRGLLNGVAYLKGVAQFVTPRELRLGSEKLICRSVLLACGSRPAVLGSLAFDHQKVLSTDDILSIKTVPATLFIIGGGVIGCEFASLFSALGAAVTLVEKMPQLLPGEDEEIARTLGTALKKKGVKVHTGADAGTFNLSDYEIVLVCVGRAPITDGLGLEKVGVRVERSGVWVDEYLRTSVPGVWAAGDCTGKYLLAHYASYQGKLAMNNIATPDCLRSADNAVVPSCVFTDPEIARVGLSLAQAQAAGYEVRVHRFDFLGSGMARILDEAEGFISIVSEKRTGQLLGGVIIGPRAGELCATLSVAITSRLTVTDLKATIIAHPTVSEAIEEALS